MTVQVNMEADSSKVESTIARLARQFRATESEARKVGDTVSKIGSGKNLKLDPAVAELQRVNANLLKTQTTLEGTFSSITRGLKTAAATLTGILASGFAVKGLVSAADQMTLLQNRIALVTGRTKELIQVQDELFLSSRRTGATVASSAEIFTKFGRAVKGTNIKELLAVTETVQQAIAISGGSAASADAAIMQLGQGLSSGVLRGEELNSVLEQAPRLAQAIADEMGVSLGALRELASDGAITTDVVFNALKNQAATIQSEFAVANKTVSKSLTSLRDIITLRLSEVDKALGTSANIAGLIEGMTDKLSNIDPASMEGLRLIVNFINVTLKYAIKDTITILGGLANVFEAIFSRIGKLYGYLLIPLKGVANEILVIIQDSFASLVAAILPAAEGAAKAIARGFGLDLDKEIGAVFKARGASAIRGALDALANEIDMQGLRWYNLANTAAIALNRIKFRIIDLAVSTGLFGSYLSNLGALVVAPFYDMLKSLGNSVSTILSPILNVFDNFFTTIERGFFWLYDMVVGNSWWPDLIDGVVDYAKNILDVSSIFENFKSIVSNAFNSLLDNLVKVGLFMAGFNTILATLVASLYALFKLVATGFAFGGIAGAIGGVLTYFLLLNNTIGALSVSFGLFVGSVTLIGTAFVSMIKEVANGANALQTFNEFLAFSATALTGTLFASLPLVISGVAADLVKLTVIFSAMLTGIASISETVLDKVGKVFSSFVKQVEAGFAWLYDKVIGNSWWPDMLYGIERLTDQVLPSVAAKFESFKGKVASVFKELFDKTKTIDIKAKLSFAKDGFDQIKDMAVSFVNVGAEVVAGIWRSVANLSPEIAAVISTGIISGILAIASPDLFKSLNKFFGIGFIAALAGAFATFAGDAALDSQFFESFGRGLGTTAGVLVTTIIENIPKMITAVVQVAQAFGSAFLDQLGIVGSAIKGLSNITGTSGILNTLIFGGGIALIFGKLDTVKKVLSGLLTLFSGASIGGVGKGSDGKKDGLIGSLLLGDGRGILAGLAAVYTAVQLIPNILAGDLTSIAGGAGLVALLMFGAGGSVKLIIDGIKQVVGAFGLFKSGKSILDTGSLVQDVAEVGNALSNLRNSTTIEGLKGSFVALGGLIKRAAITVYTDLAPAFTNLAVKARTSMATVNVAVTSSLAAMQARAETVAGPLGVVGSGLFGKLAKGVGIVAAFSLLFSGIGNAATSELSVASVSSSILDFGLVGAMLFGAAGSDVLFSKLGGFGKKIFGSLGASLAGGFKAIGSGFYAAIVSPLGNALKAAGMLLLRFVGGLPGLLLTGGLALGGLIINWLFGEESDTEKRLSALRAKAQSIKNEMEGLFSQESVNDLLSATEFKVDLQALLDDSSFEGLSEQQLTNLNIAMKTFKTVTERNGQILASEGGLTRSQIREVERAARDIEAAIREGPNPSEDPQVVSDLRGSVISALTPFLKDEGTADLLKNKQYPGPIDTLLSADAPTSVIALLDALSALDSIDMSRIDPKIGNKFIDSLSELLTSLEKTGDTGIGLKTLAFGDARAALRRKIESELIPSLEGLATEAAESFERANSGAARDNQVDKILSAAESLKLDNLSKEKLRLLPQVLLDRVQAQVLTAAQNPELLRLGSGKLGDKDSPDLDIAAPSEAALQMAKDLKTSVDAILDEAGVRAVESIGGNLERLKTRLQSVGSDLQVESIIDEASYLKAEGIIDQILQKQEKLANLDPADYDSGAKILAEIQLQKDLLLDTLGTTEQKLDNIGSLIGGIPDINAALAMDPALIAQVIAYANELRTLLALLRGGLQGVGPGAINSPVGGSTSDQALAKKSQLENAIKNILAPVPKTAPNGAGIPKVKKGGGGGGGKKDAKTWWEEFQAGLKELDLTIDSDILAGLQVGTIKELTALSGKYKAAQEALNNSAMGEVELRRKSLKLMQQARQEAIAALNDGTVGGGMAALESAGVKFDEAMIGRLNAASVAYTTQLALRIDQLTLERNTMALGSAAAVQATNAISAMKLELDAMTGSSQIMRDAFNSGLQSFLKGQTTFKDFVGGLLDTFTNTIIEKFSTSFTDSLFNSLGLDNLFGSLFGGASKLGSGLGGGLGGALQPGSSPMNPLWTTSKDDLLKGLDLGGKGGGGGGFFGWLFGLFGFAEGGSVRGPGTGTSDSILARLSAGEFVVNAKSTKQWLPLLEQINNGGKMPAFATGGMVGPRDSRVFKSAASNNKSQQVFHINVTGDVSNQTRKEVLAMLPEISAGVGIVNRERGSR